MRRLLWLLCVLVGFACRAEANALVNSGFETGDLSGWTVDGSRTPAFGVGTSGTAITGLYAAIVQTGAYAAYAAVAAQDPAFQPGGRYLGLAQTVAVQPGLYLVGFSRGTKGSSTSGLGGTRNEVLVNGAPFFFEQGVIPEGSYSTVELPVTLAGGPTTFDFHLSGSGTGLAGVSFDNFFVEPLATSPVPEPGSALLLGMALLGPAIVWRRGA